MNSADFLELAIIAFIVIGIGIAIWRGGARNPVGTGGLDKRLTAINGEVRQISSKVGEIEDRVEKVEGLAATKADITKLEQGLIERVENLARTLPDIEARQRALSDQMNKHARKADTTAATVRHIDNQVALLVGELVKKGMDK